MMKIGSVAMTDLLIAVLGFGTIAMSSDQPWPMGYHDAQHTGHSSYPGPATFSVKWKMDGLQPGGVIGSNGILYTQGVVGSAKTLYALDIHTGEIIAAAMDPCVIQALGPDGTAYALCTDDTKSIRAYDGTTLQRKWDVPMTGSWVGDITVGPGGQVLTWMHDPDKYIIHVIAFDGQSGRVIWDYAEANDNLDCCDPLAVSSDNRIVTPFGLALEGSTGSKLWENSQIGATAPVLSSSGIGYGVSGGVINDAGGVTAFSLDTGAVLWQNGGGADRSLRTGPSLMPLTTPALDSKGLVYLPWGRYLYIFDGLTGDGGPIELSPDKNCTSVVLDGQDNAYVSCGRTIFVVETQDYQFNTVAEYTAPSSMDGMLIGPDKTLYAAGMALGEGGFSLPNLYVLPAVAHTAGAEGANWRTDMVIHNPSADSIAHSVLSLLKTGQDNSDFESVEREIPPCSSMGIDDAVLSLFGHDGSGALLIQSDASNLVITSRTYNDQPQGTFGQFIPGIAESRLNGTLLTQLTENDTYRTNVGMAALYELEQTVSLELYDSSGTQLNSMDVVLPPLGHMQLNQIYRMAGVGSVKNGFIKIKNGTGLAAYASVVDNRTGDAIFIPAANVGSN